MGEWLELGMGGVMRSSRTEVRYVVALLHTVTHLPIVAG